VEFGRRRDDGRRRDARRGPDRTGPDRTEPAPAPALPDLRASYDALERTAPGDPDGVALLSELDEIVDAANGLAALAGLESIDRDEDAGQA
jgi:hypothetical protein